MFCLLFALFVAITIVKTCLTLKDSNIYFRPNSILHGKRYYIMCIYYIIIIIHIIFNNSIEKLKENSVQCPLYTT